MNIFRYLKKKQRNVLVVKDIDTLRTSKTTVTEEMHTKVGSKRQVNSESLTVKSRSSIVVS